MMPLSALRYLALAVLLAGCAGTRSHFEPGRTLEAEGRYVEAADFYLQLLMQDPEQARARQRLLEAGTAAVAMLADTADAARLRGAYDQALSVLDQLDDLRRRAEAVGTVLPAPDDLPTLRQQSVEGAITVLMNRGTQAEAAHDWSDALDAYAAVQHYDPTATQQAELDQARARIFLRWSDQELFREHYLEAYERAHQALELLEAGTPEARQARDIQAEALAVGTRYLAALPFRSATPEPHPELLQALNDVLQDRYWTTPPRFIAAADYGQLRRELRRFPYDHTTFTSQEAAEIGRVLQADYVVLGRLTHVAQQTHDAAGGPMLRAEVTYHLLDPSSGHIVDEGVVQNAVSGTDREALVRELAEQVARSVFDAVLRRIA